MTSAHARVRLAAAMAQDELGHARCTRRKGFGVEVSDETLDGGEDRLAILDDDLPHWAAFIVANLLIDGSLTTFVQSCELRNADGTARTARNPLGGRPHRVHAEAMSVAALPVQSGSARGPGASSAPDVGACPPAAADCHSQPAEALAGTAWRPCRPERATGRPGALPRKRPQPQAPAAGPELRHLYATATATSSRLGWR